MDKRNIYIKPSVGLEDYILLAYWLFFTIIYFAIDLFIDLHTDEDYLNVLWYANAVVLPFTGYTIYRVRRSLFTVWYSYIIYPLIIYGLYLGSAYFTALKLDLLISASVKQEVEKVMPVNNVQQVFARKAGFIHTNVVLYHQQHLMTFKGTRTSYFLIKPYKSLRLETGQSYLGSYYVTHINVSAHERWISRKAYFEDWLNRHYGLLIAIPLIFFLKWVGEKYFSATPVTVYLFRSLYRRIFNRLFITLLTLLGISILTILLIGLFA